MIPLYELVVISSFSQISLITLHVNANVIIVKKKMMSKDATMGPGGNTYVPWSSKSLYGNLNYDVM